MSTNLYFNTKAEAESYLKNNGYQFARIQYDHVTAYEKNRHVVFIEPEHDGNTPNDRHYIDFNPRLAGY